MGTGLIASCSTPTPAADAAEETASTEGEVCAPEHAELEFGILSAKSAENLKPQWGPFLKDMSDALGRPAIGLHATDCACVIKGMGAGEAQMAWCGGKPHIEAAARSQAEAFAQTVATDGSKGHCPHLITDAENPIVSEINPEAGDGNKCVIENAANLTFAFNDPNSASEFLVPTCHVFAQNGASAEAIFNQLIFAGSHEATALTVAENQVDVATNNNGNLERLKETAPDALEKIQVIWTSPAIPSDPLACRSDLPDCLKESIQEFAFNCDNAEALEKLQWSGLDPAKGKDWSAIRELQIAKDILEAQSNENLSDADKQAQLDELNSKLEALKQWRGTAKTVCCAGANGTL